MQFQKNLQGIAKGSVPVEVLLKHVDYLLSEMVTVRGPGFKSTGAILQQYRYDGENFDIEFSQQALDFLQETNDPRVEILAVLFAEIG